MDYSFPMIKQSPPTQHYTVRRIRLNRFNRDLMLVDFKLPLDLFNTFSTACIAVVQIVLVLVALLAVYCLAVTPVLFVIWVIQRFYLGSSNRSH